MSELEDEEERKNSIIFFYIHFIGGGNIYTGYYDPYSKNSRIVAFHWIRLTGLLLIPMIVALSFAATTSTHNIKSIHLIKFTAFLF